MTWFTFSLLSITALAIAELTQQHILGDKVKINERASAVLTFFIQSVFTIPIIFFSTYKYQLLDIFKPSVLPNVILVTIIASVGMVFYLKSFKVKKY